MLVKKCVYLFFFSFLFFLFFITVIIVVAFTRQKRNTKALAFVRNKDSIALLVQKPVEQSATLLPDYYGDCCGVVHIYGGAEQSQTFTTLIIIFTFPSFLFIIISSFFLSVIFWSSKNICAFHLSWPTPYIMHTFFFFSELVTVSLFHKIPWWSASFFCRHDAKLCFAQHSCFLLLRCSLLVYVSVYMC